MRGFLIWWGWYILRQRRQNAEQSKKDNEGSWGSSTPFFSGESEEIQAKRGSGKIHEKNEKEEGEMTKRYNKLVRDRIPENIVREGLENPILRTLNKKEFFEAAKKKVLEEAKELVAAESEKETIDEIVDILELIDTLIAEMGIPKFDICTLRRKKNEKKGAFKKQLFLIKTETKPRV